MPPLAPDGFQLVPPGKVAAIVTSLEMTAMPPAGSERQAPPGVRLELMQSPAVAWYRALFRKVGENWLWFSRLRLDEATLARVIDDAAVEVYVLKAGEDEAGILELDFREAGTCEIAFLGLAPGFEGRGLGGYLMSQAINRAWSRPISRLWVHTCTLDHPSALPFYIRSGFRAYEQQVEIADDPRARGELPADAAPQIPQL